MCKREECVAQTCCSTTFCGTGQSVKSVWLWDEEKHGLCKGGTTNDSPVKHPDQTSCCFACWWQEPGSAAGRGVVSFCSWHCARACEWVISDPWWTWWPCAVLVSRRLQQDHGSDLQSCAQRVIPSSHTQLPSSVLSLVACWLTLEGLLQMIGLHCY